MMEPTSSGRHWDVVRRVLGCVLLPPSAASVGLLTYDAMWHVGLLPQGAPIHSVDAAESLGLGIAILAVVMLGGVIPGVAWLSRTGRLSIGSLVMLGAALGNVPFVVIVVGIMLAAITRGESLTDIGHYWYGPTGALVRVVLGAITGMGAALIYWVVAVFWAGNGDRP